MPRTGTGERERRVATLAMDKRGPQPDRVERGCIGVHVARVRD
jgi:hypothetical protein